MSITGDLQHFPIIDIIQLLNGTRISGVLRVSSEKGESQLVFHNGDLVSANYLNSRVRVGQVLVSSGAITDEQLTEALEIQKHAGKRRKPLVLTLLEHAMIDESAAYSGIEALIEMTIVEVLTWKSGRFALDMAAADTVDGYHFSSTKFQQQILLNAQGIVLESLRIFDEKMRDGTMDEILAIAGVTNLDLDSGLSETTAPTLGVPAAGQDAAVSGAASLQQFAEQRIKIQSGDDRSFRTVAAVKRLVASEFAAAPASLKLELATILAGTASPVSGSGARSGLAVVVLTQSPLLATMVKAVCLNENIYVVAPEDRAAIDITIRLLLCQNLLPLILIDMPHASATADPASLYQEYLKYGQTSVVLMACSRMWGIIGLRSPGAGVRGVIPRPCRECGEDSFAEQALAFCTELGPFLRTCAPEFRNKDEQRFFDCLSQLRSCKTRLEITQAVLSFLIDPFERAIVFSIAAPELVAELSFGVMSAKSDAPTTLLNLRIPLDDQPIFQEVIVTGQLYYGFHSDSSHQHLLYREIGIPECPEVLLFPLVRANRVVAVIYADFGSKPVSPPALKFLEAVVQYTTAQVSVTAYRQKIKSMLEETARTH